MERFAQKGQVQRVFESCKVQVKTGKECRITQKDKRNTVFFDNLEACFKRRNPQISQIFVLD